MKLSDLKPDTNNANKGSERGSEMIETSLQKLGAGRSIVVDKNGRVIGGNKTLQAAEQVGIEDGVIVETTGDQLVIVRRTDLDLDDPTGKARQLAYADNQTSQVSMEFDPDVLAADLAAGIELDNWFDDWELERLEEKEVLPPDDFPEYGDGITTEYCCPKCNYEWSGKPK